MTKKKSNSTGRMRVFHRYLGFFLAGIMAVYAISGIILIFRSTDFLKSEVIVEKELKPNLTVEQLDEEIRGKVEITEKESDLWYFNKGTYQPSTGIAKVKKMELPYVIEKMEHLHKANTNSPLYFLNIFFGLSLLFFVISAFWMYTPKMPIFKKGMYFTLAGLALTLILLFV
tara:strand:- start:12946 stop:13461 length:516 start_codon:yes stop_codon:yes gene_type:complete